ncbi:hypothetical protein AGMMS49921_02110 [Endomicrobiia bacterium]|nr:hypothetical protein AGMMS49921_02110 [Endomicrobiia bacterium]
MENELYIVGRLITKFESIPHFLDGSIPTGLDAFPGKFCKNERVDPDELFEKLDVSGLAELDELLKEFDEERSAEIFERDKSLEYLGIN